MIAAFKIRAQATPILVFLLLSWPALCWAEHQPGGAGQRPVMWMRFGRPDEEPSAKRGAPSNDPVSWTLQKTFDVRSSSERLTASSLGGIRVVWLCCPDTPPGPASPPTLLLSEIEALLKFVQAGGGLLVFTCPAAPQNANQAPLNQFLHRLGVSVSPVSIGPKRQKLPDTCPLIGGLHWTAHSLHTLDIDENSPVTPPVLVMNDLQQKPAQTGTRDYAGAVMIWGDYGKGRVAIIADGGWGSQSTLSQSAASAPDPQMEENCQTLNRLSVWLAEAGSSSTKTPQQRQSTATEQ